MARHRSDGAPIVLYNPAGRTMLKRDHPRTRGRVMRTSGRRSYHKLILSLAVGALALFFVLETMVRMIIDLPAKTDFYSSIHREDVPALQKKFGVKTAHGPGWIHLGWVAHPEKERYRIYRLDGDAETPLGETRYGASSWKGPIRKEIRLACAFRQ